MNILIKTNREWRRRSNKTY